MDREQRAARQAKQEPLFELGPFWGRLKGFLSSGSPALLGREQGAALRQGGDNVPKLKHSNQAALGESFCALKTQISLPALSQQFKTPVKVTRP